MADSQPSGPNWVHSAPPPMSSHLHTYVLALCVTACLAVSMWPRSDSPRRLSQAEPQAAGPELPFDEVGPDRIRGFREPTPQIDAAPRRTLREQAGAIGP